MESFRNHVSAHRRDILKSFLIGLPGAIGLSRLLSIGTTSPGASQEALAAAKSTNIPTLSTPPPGYRLTWVYHGRPDGFKTGPTEVAFFYINSQYVLSQTNPVALFVSPKTTTQFALTEDHSYESVNLQIGNVPVPILARYYDGAWMGSPTGEVERAKGARVTWDTSNFHSIAFDYESYSIGIRACRRGNVLREDLLATARSLR